MQNLFLGLLRVTTFNFHRSFNSDLILGSFLAFWGPNVVLSSCGGSGSQRLLSLNPTTVLVVLLLGL